MTYAQRYLEQAARIAELVPPAAVEAVVSALARTREHGGRLFVVGSGGGAAHASHAAGDFRKLAGIEAYSPSDNVAELTARVNDDGWETSYVEWLRGSRFSKRDALLVFSVGGGDAERGISLNLVRCVEHVKAVGGVVLGIVGRDGGLTARLADACVVIPVDDEATVTPHTEGIQSVVAHLLVSHPALQVRTAKWESVT